MIPIHAILAYLSGHRNQSEKVDVWFNNTCSIIVGAFNMYEALLLCLTHYLLPDDLNDYLCLYSIIRSLVSLMKSKLDDIITTDEQRNSIIKNTTFLYHRMCSQSESIFVLILVWIESVALLYDLQLYDLCFGAKPILI